MGMKFKGKTPVETKIIRSLPWLDKLKVCAEIAEKRGNETARRACYRRLAEHSVKRRDFENAWKLIEECHLSEDEIVSVARRAIKLSDNRSGQIEICMKFGLVQDIKDFMLPNLIEKQRETGNYEGFDYALKNGMMDFKIRDMINIKEMTSVRDMIIKRASKIIQEYSLDLDETGNDPRINKAMDEVKPFLRKYGMEDSAKDAALSAMKARFMCLEYDEVIAIARSFGICRADWDKDAKNAILESLGNLWIEKGSIWARGMSAELGIDNTPRGNDMMAYIKYIALRESIWPGNYAKTMKLADEMGFSDSDIKNIAEEVIEKLFGGELENEIKIARIMMEYRKGDRHFEHRAKKHAKAFAEIEARAGRFESATDVLMEFGLKKRRKELAERHISQLLEAGNYDDAKEAAERYGLVEEASQIRKIETGLGK